MSLDGFEMIREDRDVSAANAKGGGLCLAGEFYLGQRFYDT